MDEKAYQVIITKPASKRYQERILNYLIDNFSAQRVLEIDAEIFQTVISLQNHPLRGRKEDYLRRLKEEFRFILCKEPDTSKS